MDARNEKKTLSFGILCLCLCTVLTVIRKDFTILHLLTFGVVTE